MEVKFEDIEPRTVIGVRRKVAKNEIGDFFGEILPKSAGFAVENGMQMSGMPMGIYYSVTDTEFDMAAGVPVEKVTATSEEIQEIELPGGRTAQTVHHGHYDGLTDSWAELTAQVEKAGERVRMPCWEQYLDDPGDMSDPSKLRTLLVEPLE